MGKRRNTDGTVRAVSFASLPASPTADRCLAGADVVVLVVRTVITITTTITITTAITITITTAITITISIVITIIIVNLVPSHQRETAILSSHLVAIAGPSCSQVKWAIHVTPSCAMRELAATTSIGSGGGRERSE